MKVFKELRIFFLFAAVCICAYTVRDMIYEREAERIGAEYKKCFGKDINFIPFLVESSMMYSYAKDVGCGDGIKEYDSSLSGMKDISVHRQFTSGLEYFLGYGYKIKNYLFPSPSAARAPNEYEDNPDFTNWIRIQLRAWISLISGLIFLWLIALRIPYKTALFGGILHAVCSSAIARYTAQDIVRGNFTLPLIVATFTSAAWFLRDPTKRKLFITALVSFLAIATWDMTQICFSVWCLAEITRILAGGKVNRKRKELWYTVFISAILAAFLIPYHREHLLIVSPFVIILLPSVIILQHVAPGKSFKVRIANFAISLAAFGGIWMIITKSGGFGGNYGHFAELMKAKIRFLNVKPANPGLLSFDARSVWVPAMHSADRYITKAFFPLLLHVAAISLILSLMVSKIRKEFFRMMGIANFALFMAVFYSLSFFFIVRYHVFVSVFLAVLIPIMIHIWLKKAKDLEVKDAAKSIIFIIIYFTFYNIYFYGFSSPMTVMNSALYPLAGAAVAFLVAALFGVYKIFIKKVRPPLYFYGKILIGSMAAMLLVFEIDGLQSTRQYQDIFFPETAALLKWIRKENVEDAVLADFQLSPLLKAYTNSKIIMQPKFELGETRKNYEDFINIMFHGNEEELARFSSEKGARYFIFDKGYPNSKSVYSPRYMGDALEPLKKDSPAYMMSMTQNRAKLRNFYEIYPPQALKLISNRYILFQVISDKDKKRAEKWASDAEKEMRNGNMPMAGILARSAIFANPNCPEAEIIYINIFKRPPLIRLRGY